MRLTIGLALFLFACNGEDKDTDTLPAGAGTPTPTGAATGTPPTGTGGTTGSGSTTSTGSTTGTGSTTSLPSETFVDPPTWTPVGGVYELEMQPTTFSVNGIDHCVRGYGSIPGPTLRIASSATDREVRVDYTNGLTSSSIQGVGAATYDFNVTNLHTHGLHVSPNTTTDGTYWSDNVLLEMDPNDPTFEFRFDIDERETHNAGTFWYHPHVHGATSIQVGSGMAGALIIEGDYDDIAAIDAATERVMVLQHIPWDSVTGLAGGATCDENNFTIDGFGDITQTSPTLVNGVLEPVIVTAPDQMEHWRMVHAGVTDDMDISLYPATGSDCSSWNANAPETLRQIAADGIALSAGFDRTTVMMAPGYRVDVMAQAPSTEGTYCLVAERPGGPPPAAPSEDVLLEWVVSSAAGTATSTAMPSDNDLAGVSPATLDCASPVDANQTATLDSPAPCTPLNIDCRSFDDSLLSPRILPVNTTEEWTVSTGAATHPFHIHVNPFTVCDDMPDEPPAPHWRDTLLLDNTARELHMEYPLFTGDFVIHCHKLNHEDSGMMELVRIE